MKNQYQDYFETLKYYLLTLEIEVEKIDGCEENEVKSLEDNYGKLPLAYKEYLKSIGKKLLFSLMNGEDMSYKGIDKAVKLGKKIFLEDKLIIERPYLAISERRYEFITMLYLDEGDNPSTWIMSDGWDEEDGENLAMRTKTFTELMNNFFGRMLLDYSSGFYWIDVNEEGDKERIIRDRFKTWAENLQKVKNHITNSGESDNGLILELNEQFDYYYRANEDFIIKMSGSENVIEMEQEENIDEPQRQSKNIFKIIREIFSKK